MNDPVKNANFIPSYRFAARKRRRRLNAWVTGSIAYMTVLLALYAGSHALWSGAGGALADEQAQTNARIQRAGQDIRAAQGELAAQEVMLKAIQSVQKQPDWSILLALVPTALGDEVFLTRCEVRPENPAGYAAAPAAAAPPAAAKPGAGATFRLKMSGYGRTMAAVLRFAQELERLDLFDQVQLVKTTPETLRSGGAISFQIECALGAKGGNPK